MQRSYLVKSSIHFTNHRFFVKVGDILVHDPANGNKLTVYRNGAIVKDVQQTTLGITAFVQNGMIAEVATPAQVPTAASKAPAKPIPAKKEASAVNWGGSDMSSKPKPPKEPNPLPKPLPTKKREEPVIIKPEPKKPSKVEIEDETI